MGMMKLVLTVKATGETCEVQRLTYPSDQNVKQDDFGSGMMVLYGRGADKSPSRLASLEFRPVRVNKCPIYVVSVIDYHKILKPLIIIDEEHDDTYINAKDITISRKRIKMK